MAEELGTTDTTPVDESADMSVAEHEAQFGSDAGTPPPPDPNPEPEENIRRPPRERDEDGKFKPEKHRAAKSQASAADVPRIAELTRKLREAEAERDALRSRPVVEAPMRQPVAAPVSRETQPPETTKRDWTKEVERYKAMPDAPKIDDFNEYGDWGMAIDLFIGEKRAEEQAHRTRQETERQQLEVAWRGKVESAKDRYADFEQVALLAPTTIPQGSLIDAWILEDTSGADVLYTLQKDPAELRRVLALPLFEQVKALSQIALRLSPSRVPAAKTGAAAAVPVKVAPRPPTPVRTSAVPAPDEPPGDEASIAEHEAFYHRRRSY